MTKIYWNLWNFQKLITHYTKKDYHLWWGRAKPVKVFTSAKSLAEPVFLPSPMNSLYSLSNWADESLSPIMLALASFVLQSLMLVGNSASENQASLVGYIRQGFLSFMLSQVIKPLSWGGFSYITQFFYFHIIQTDSIHPYVPYPQERDYKRPFHCFVLFCF